MTGFLFCGIISAILAGVATCSVSHPLIRIGWKSCSPTRLWGEVLSCVLPGVTSFSAIGSFISSSGHCADAPHPGGLSQDNPAVPRDLLEERGAIGPTLFFITSLRNLDLEVSYALSRHPWRNHCRNRLCGCDFGRDPRVADPHRGSQRCGYRRHRQRLLHRHPRPDERFPRPGSTRAGLAARGSTRRSRDGRAGQLAPMRARAHPLEHRQAPGRDLSRLLT